LVSAPSDRRPALRLSVSSEGDSAVVEVGGEVDLATAAHLQQFVERVIDIGYRDVVLDLGATSYMDSIGLGAVVGLDRLAREAGGAVRLRHPTARVRRLLDLTLVGTVLHVEPDGSAAADARAVRPGRHPGP
jgi:anti-sigma B factor antagonist